MKKSILILFFLGFILSSCKDDGSIVLINRISNAKISDVRWGDTRIAGEILPGESQEKKVDKSDLKKKQEHKITFTMQAKQKSVYLSTIRTYIVNFGETTEIILEDSTKVSN